MWDLTATEERLVHRHDGYVYTVATSAEEARAIGYLRPSDRLTLDPDALISDAKKAALGLAAGGYKPPRRRRFKVPGASGRAAIELFLYQIGNLATQSTITTVHLRIWDGDPSLPASNVVFGDLTPAVSLTSSSTWCQASEARYLTIRSHT